MSKKILEQHIAVFGESGSGKTVLLSSFYGLMGEKGTQERTRLNVVADDTGQGHRLLQNYLGMSRDGRVPPTNRFSSTSYSFTAWLQSSAGAKKQAKYDGIRLVWHDYPGEWFHQSPSGPEEEQRRADTFRSLLASDVAIVLIDGEELVRNAGSEEQYLRLLFTNVRNGLRPVVQDVLGSGKPLARFPRIWMFALSKSDVLPDLDVAAFKDLIILKAAHEVDQLRNLIKQVVLGNEALSVGEDFVRLSSAKFTPEAIKVDQRIGVDLMMPIASVLPLQRFLRWAESKILLGKVAEVLLGHASAAAGVLVVLLGVVGKMAKIPGPLGAIAVFVSSVVTKQVINKALGFAEDKLREANAVAVAQGDYLGAALTQFSIDLKEGEKQDILLRSQR